MNCTVRKGFITQQIGDNLVIFEGEESMLFTLNPTAAYIFRRIKIGENIARIAKSLSTEFKIPEREAVDDVKACVREFLNDGIIERSS